MGRRRMTRTERTAAAQRVGRAYQASDGTVRWVLRMSDSGLYHTAFKRADVGCWQDGSSLGIHPVQEWSYYDGPEVPAPPVGERLPWFGVLGNHVQKVVTRQGDGSLYAVFPAFAPKPK